MGWYYNNLVRLKGILCGLIWDLLGNVVDQKNYLYLGLRSKKCYSGVDFLALLAHQRKNI
ncbi:MAG: hypothetical protein CMQ31_01095 [Gammaproteobacteria bacterium]|nr:hypothetical protein [Gammaproteobacteria bacterium]